MTAERNHAMNRRRPRKGTDCSTCGNSRSTSRSRGGLLSRVVGEVKAVDDISFDVRRGEVVGLVGESGSGKTTTGRTILRLTEPTAGDILFDGVDITKCPRGNAALRKDMQIVFQDPMPASIRA